MRRSHASAFSPTLWLCALVAAFTLAVAVPDAAAEDPEAPEETVAEPEATDEELPPAGADDLLPRHRLLYMNLLAARLNPLGLEDRLAVEYRLRLWDNPGVLFRDAFVGIGFTPSFSPAVTRIGGTLTVKPLAVLQLAASAYWVSWFGTFQYLQSYTSANAPFSDTDLDEGEEAGRNYDTSGFEAEFQIQALAKVWQIVLRNDLKFYYDDMALNGPDTLFYNIRIDQLVPNEGWSLTNDTDLVWLSDFGLVAGIRTTITHAFFRDDKDFLPGEDTDADSALSVRTGPLIAWVIADDLGAAWNKPTVLVIANWWLKHRYRTGEDVSQAFPYIVLGFRFEGEIWASE